MVSKPLLTLDCESTRMLHRYAAEHVALMRAVGLTADTAPYRALGGSDGVAEEAPISDQIPGSG